eukprot:458543_1
MAFSLLKFVAVSVLLLVPAHATETKQPEVSELKSAAQTIDGFVNGTSEMAFGTGSKFLDSEIARQHATEIVGLATNNVAFPDRVTKHLENPSAFWGKVKNGDTFSLVLLFVLVVVFCIVKDALSNLLSFGFMIAIIILLLKYFAGTGEVTPPEGEGVIAKGDGVTAERDGVEATVVSGGDTAVKVGDTAANGGDTATAEDAGATINGDDTTTVGGGTAADGAVSATNGDDTATGGDAASVVVNDDDDAKAEEVKKTPL